MVISRMFIKRWDSLDIPMSFWLELSAGKLEYIRKSPKKGGPVYISDQDAWDNLYDLYVNYFGHNEAFLKIKKHEHNAAKLKLQFMENPEKYKFNKTLIRIEEANIEQIKSGMMGGMSIREANVHVSKYMGGGIIDLKKTSVLDYFTILKEYGKANTKG